jgi:nucleotide-binding universal stress UspA family protein
MEPKTAAHPGQIATVLVPTDFSEESFKALRYAAALVRKFGAKLHVVHVSEIDFAIPGVDLKDKDPLISDEEVAQRVRQQLDDVAATFHGRIGRAFDQICRFAREIEADLIVMSTHGRTGLKRLFLGSNAERVVQHSSSPVLVVRESEREFFKDGQPLQIQKILVPTDFSKPSREALEYAVQFGRQLGARLVLFHSFTTTEFLTPEPYLVQEVGAGPGLARAAAEDQMREFIQGVDFGGVDFETYVTTGLAADEICDYAAKKGIDLVITSTHGRTGLMHVLIGSVAEHIVRSAPSPVLVVPGRHQGV